MKSSSASVSAAYSCEHRNKDSSNNNLTCQIDAVIILADLTVATAAALLIALFGELSTCQCLLGAGAGDGEVCCEMVQLLFSLKLA